MVVDDHPAFRAGLTALLQNQPDMTVVAEADNGRDAVAVFRREKPDIILMDLRLPGISGVEAIMAIRAEFPKARVIVVTTYDRDEDIYRAMQSGAQSYLLKDMSMEAIVSNIRAVHAGEHPLAPNLANRLATRIKRGDLSQRELEILQLLVKGRSNKEMANSLSLSEDTIKFHLKSVFTKLSVQSRSEAAVRAVLNGIVQVE